MKPTPFQVFCGYFLGLDRDLRYRFFNAGSLARYFEISPDELRAAMEEYHLTPEQSRHVDYNLAKAHADAQEIAMFGGREDVEQFAKRTYREFVAAFDGYEPSKDFENVDYDHLFPGDSPRKSDDDPGD